ncbi:MAG: hypothetical protein ACI4EG_01545 [Fusicatenibacter sp.]
MDKLFRIGDFCFRLLFPENLPFPSNFLLFETKQGLPEYSYQLCITDKIPQLAGKVIAVRSDIVVYQTSFGESRLLGIKGKDTFYACYHEISEEQAEVLLSMHEISGLHIDPVFSSMFALERHMIKRDSLILHCAYMVYQGKAILFSAPSGTGKSTQAGLWERYRGSRTVNGDRALLRKISGRWSACGWPVCGSSDICELGDTPLQAVVMLRQGDSNHIEQLSPIQAFTQLYAQITINQWNRAFVQHAMELIEDLIGQVPVYQLTCDMTEDAVNCLEHTLFPESNTVEDGLTHER